MTGVAIVREEAQGDTAALYRAITNDGRVQSIGTTAGEALDALTEQLSDEDSGTVVVIQQMHPDGYFGESQILRLRELMQRSQASALTAEEWDELQALIEAELNASSLRCGQLADALRR
jgi:hypothetical protein